MKNFVNKFALTEHLQNEENFSINQLATASELMPDDVAVLCPWYLYLGLISDIHPVCSINTVADTICLDKLVSQWVTLRSYPCHL